MGLVDSCGSLGYMPITLYLLSSPAKHGHEAGKHNALRYAISRTVLA